MGGNSKRRFVCKYCKFILLDVGSYNEHVRECTVKRCCVKSCKSNTIKMLDKEGHISVFKIPTDDYFKKLWLDALPDNKMYSIHGLVCLKHFTKHDLIINNNEISIKHDAVPSIFNVLDSQDSIEKCDVPGCTNDTDLYMLNSPIDEKVFEEWHKTFAIVKLDLTDESLICSDHFGDKNNIPDAFIKTSGIPPPVPIINEISSDSSVQCIEDDDPSPAQVASRICCVPGCVKLPHEKLGFHTFPLKDELEVEVIRVNGTTVMDLHDIWKETVGIKKVYPDTVVCTKHFRESDYVFDRGADPATVTLAQTAIPRKHLPRIQSAIILPVKRKKIREAWSLKVPETYIKATKSPEIKHCSVQTCGSDSRSKPQLAFFRLPIEERRAKEWLYICDRTDLFHKGYQHARKEFIICSLHFKSSMMAKRFSPDEIFLQPHAIPMINDPLALVEPVMEEDHQTSGTPVPVPLIKAYTPLAPKPASPTTSMNDNLSRLSKSATGGLSLENGSSDKNPKDSSPFNGGPASRANNLVYIAPHKNNISKYVKCAVPSCANYFDQGKIEYLGLSHFRFPEDPVLSTMWKKAIGRPDSWDPGDSRVCANHFVTSQLLPQTLQENAVPTQFLDDSSNTKKSNLEVKKLNDTKVYTITRPPPLPKLVPICQYVEKEKIIVPQPVLKIPIPALTPRVVKLKCKPGRKPKSKPPVDPNIPKRKPGRPRKRNLPNIIRIRKAKKKQDPLDPDDMIEIKEETYDILDESSLPERGRPRKGQYVPRNDNVEYVEGEEPPRKRRGRPPKTDKLLRPKRPVGRPRKDQSFLAESECKNYDSKDEPLEHRKHFLEVSTKSNQSLFGQISSAMELVENNMTFEVDNHENIEENEVEIENDKLEMMQDVKTEPDIEIVEPEINLDVTDDENLVKNHTESEITYTQSLKDVDDEDFFRDVTPLILRLDYKHRHSLKQFINEKLDIFNKC